MYFLINFICIIIALFFFFTSIPTYGDATLTSSSGVTSGSYGVSTVTSTVSALNPGVGVVSLSSLQRETGTDIRADEFEYIGNNMIAKGNIMIRKEGMLVYADMGVLNSGTKNIEVAGNVRFYNLVRFRQELDYWELAGLEKNPYTKLKVVGTVMTASGRQKIVVDVMQEQLAWSGDKAVGNLKTGIFEFGNFISKLDTLYCLAKRGTYYPDGKLVVKDATLSTCPDIVDGHSAYNWYSTKIVAYPNSTATNGIQGEGVKSTGEAFGNYHVWTYNNLIYIGDIPILWLPVVYKPAESELGNWTIGGGYKDNYWGANVQTTNYWKIMDNPGLSLANMFDYYQYRGFGYGNQTELTSKDSTTELFVYGIDDKTPNKTLPLTTRFGELDSGRYDLTLKNVTHLTDRLDFRGQFAKLSDLYFLYDYFNRVAMVDPQPATYMNLAYQFDKLSLNLMFRPEVNNFFSEVGQLPKLQMDIPREELFHNIYYQGQTSFGQYRMSWRHFTNPSPLGYDPKSYMAARFDTVNFLYYPLKLYDVNFIPRSGIRFTGYDRSSKNKVTAQDIDKMIAAEQAEGASFSPYTNYDGQGNQRYRWIPELGLTMDTKISKSWYDVKSAFFDMDGLRHVVFPYLDYTFIPEPNESCSHIYYFDDIDRIDRQNFVRAGLQNRLETRRGYQVYTWATMENYIDFLVQPKQNAPASEDGWEHLGDFGNKITITPMSDLSLNGTLLINTAQLSHATLNESWANFIEQFNVNAQYQLVQGWGLTAGYFYTGEGNNASEYSMGSSLAEIESASSFIQTFSKSSSFSGGITYQINERTAGEITLDYDLKNDLMPGLTISIIRALPGGLELSLWYTLSHNRKRDGHGMTAERTFGWNLGLNSSPNYAISPREELLPDKLTREANR